MTTNPTNPEERERLLNQGDDPDWQPAEKREKCREFDYMDLIRKPGLVTTCRWAIARIHRHMESSRACCGDDVLLDVVSELEAAIANAEGEVTCRECGGKGTV